MMDNVVINDKPLSYYLQEPRRTTEIQEGVLDGLLQDNPASEHLHYLKLVQHFLETGDWDRDLLARAAAHTNDRQVLHLRMASVAELAAVSNMDDEVITQSPLTDEPPSEQEGPAAEKSLAKKTIARISKEPDVVKTTILPDPEEEIFRPKKSKKKSKKKPRIPKRNRLDKALKDLHETEGGTKPNEFVAWLKDLEDLSRLRDTATSRVGPVKKKVKKRKNKKKSQPILDETPISETLASLLAKQGRTLQAKAMYEQLSLKYPEKSSFFAAKIKALADKN